MSKLVRKIRVGITMGDPSGIGPAIVARALPKVKKLAEFVVIGDRWVFTKIPNPNGSTTLTIGAERSRSAKSQIPSCKFIDLDNINHKNFQFGRIKAEYGRAALEYLDKALELIKKKEIDCLVTCPVSKEAVNLSGIDFSGHTEYLAEYTNTRDFAMMLLNKQLRISLVTRHVALKEVPRQLNKDKLSKTILLTYKSLKELFLIRNPRLVICGLNPHASDNGLLGDEENKIIKPLLKNLRTKIRNIDGPLSSDVAMYKAKQKAYDAVVAMYHDQALIPLKLVGNQTGVNLTLGLPFIRTSPLHGTAFDIAAVAHPVNPNSLIEAVRLAIKCALNRKKD